MKPLPQISHWNYQFIFHKLSRLSIIECYIPWTFFPQGLHGQNLHVLTNRFYCGKVCHILDMEALGAGVNLNAFSGQLQNSKILGHHSQMDIIYIWAKCCMLANQPERMSLFLVTSSSCTGCASAMKFYYMRVDLWASYVSKFYGLWWSWAWFMAAQTFAINFIRYHTRYQIY